MTEVAESDYPLVSVVVPCFNHEKYINECIESVMEQTYSNIELIVIDDGSTDKSLDELNKLQKKYNFKLFTQENKGITGTLNRGLNIAEGKYFCILASDDFWAPEKIKEQVSYLEQNPDAKLCFNDIIHVDSKSNKIKKGAPYAERVHLKQDFEYVLMYGTLPPASIMGRMTDIVECRGFDENLAVEDLDIWLNILKEGGYAKILDKHLSYYRFHESNTHSKKEKLIDEHYKTILKYLPFSKNKRKVQVEWALRSANKLADVNKKKSLHYLFKGLSKFWDSRIYKSIVKWVVK